MPASAALVAAETGPGSPTAAVGFPIYAAGAVPIACEWAVALLNCTSAVDR